jgi:hypothetical protein
MSVLNNEISPEAGKELNVYYETLIQAYYAKMPKILIAAIRNACTIEEAEKIFAYYNTIGRSRRFIMYTAEERVTTIKEIHAALKFFGIDRPAVPEILNWIEF